MWRSSGARESRVWSLVGVLGWCLRCEVAPTRCILLVPKLDSNEATKISEDMLWSMFDRFDPRGVGCSKCQVAINDHQGQQVFIARCPEEACLHDYYCAIAVFASHLRHSRLLQSAEMLSESHLAHNLCFGTYSSPDAHTDKKQIGLLFSCHTTHDTLRSGYASTLCLYDICICLICKSTVCSTCIRFFLRACLALVDVYCCVT